jgi:hypothetical protein
MEAPLARMRVCFAVVRDVLNSRSEILYSTLSVLDMSPVQTIGVEHSYAL